MTGPLEFIPPRIVHTEPPAVMGLGFPAPESAPGLLLQEAVDSLHSPVCHFTLGVELCPVTDGSEKSHCCSVCSGFSSYPSPWKLLICFLSLWSCLFWTFHIKGIIQHVTFCVWLLSLGIMFFRLIYAVAFIRTWFLSMAESYCSVWRDHGLLIHSSIGRPFGLFPSLDCLAVMLLWAVVYKLLCRHGFSSFLRNMPRSGSAGPSGNSLTFWGTTTTMAAPFYIPSSNVWGFLFLHILVNICYLLFFFPLKLS